MSEHANVRDPVFGVSEVFAPHRLPARLVARREAEIDHLAPAGEAAHALLVHLGALGGREGEAVAGEQGGLAVEGHRVVEEARPVDPRLLAGLGGRSGSAPR